MSDQEASASAFPLTRTEFEAGARRRMRAGREQHDAGRAHEAGENYQNARHDPRSLNSWAIAARSSAMPSPEREDVVNTPGNAAGCFIS